MQEMLDSFLCAETLVAYLLYYRVSIIVIHYTSSVNDTAPWLTVSRRRSQHADEAEEPAADRCLSRGVTSWLHSTITPHSNAARCSMVVKSRHGCCSVSPSYCTLQEIIHISVFGIWQHLVAELITTQCDSW